MTGVRGASDNPESKREAARALPDPRVRPPAASRVAGQTFAGCESTWRRVVATLVHDSHQHRRIVGARSLVTDQRRLLFETGDIEIDLEIGRSRVTGRLRMLGQVTANEPGPIPAWVIAEGASGHFEAELDDIGQFSLDGLASGVHRLEIGLNYELIEIPALQL